MITPLKAALRPVSETDQAFLRALFLDTRRDEFTALAWPAAEIDKLLDLQYEAQCRQYRADYPAGQQSIIVVDGQPVGQLYVEKAPGAIRIIDLSLLRSQRNRGVGTALLQALQAEAAARGVPIRLSVASGNPAARLYVRLGFAVTSGDQVYRELAWSSTRSATD